MAREDAEIDPLRAAPDVPQSVSYQLPENYPVADFPPVQARLLAQPDGGYMLLAANSVDMPVDAVFHVSVLGATGSVTRSVRRQRGRGRRQFADLIEGYGRARLCAGVCPADSSGSAAAVGIRVAITPHPDQENIFEEYDPAGRIGKTNLFLNPGLEEAALPGWPDYIRGWFKGPRIGQPGCAWELDAGNPREGRFALRMDSPSASGAYCFFGPTGAANRPYVLSFYARASRDGQSIQVAGLWPGKFQLTTEWERYWVAGTLPAAWPGRRNLLTFKINQYDGGSVWLDAIQFEEGDQPGPFTYD